MRAQVLKQNCVIENEEDVFLVSHQLANELRELYDLPIIDIEKDTKKEMGVFSNELIANLSGLLKDYDTTDLEENSVDVIKARRENIS
jgi:hypothetical protein